MLDNFDETIFIPGHLDELINSYYYYTHVGHLIMILNLLHIFYENKCTI